jgi:outer membrane protein OmpA-like peptidoglycan-associated protein
MLNKIVIRMKKNSFYVIAAVMTMVILGSCNGLKKMEKYIEELGATATPNPLEVHGDSVEITISGKFPPKYFAKKASVEATPVLVYGGGETKYKMQGYQGEQAAGNGAVIPYKTGKSFSYTDRIGYKPEMETSKLELRIHGKQGSKEADFAPVPVADGIITTPYLLKNDDKCVWSKDNFVRTLSYTNDSTQINFDYNSSVVKPAELKQQDLTNLANFLNTAAANPRMVIKGIEFVAYASPEGEMLLNDNLANERAEAGKKAFMDLVKKNKVTTVNEGMFTMSPKGEDWEGFRKAMEVSNIEDRNIIINVLKMTSDLQQREQEIKNISKTYLEIQKDIFPSLRRCRMIVKYDLEGYSDAELIQIGSSNPSSLKYEELMKAGSLIDDLAKKSAIYQAATQKTDADYRAFNNLGCVYYMQNKLSDAEAQWSKAYGMKKCTETSNNKGVVTRISGDRKGALTFFNEASGSSEASYNKGLIDVQNGDYSSAISKMGSYNTFNTALAKLLNKDNGGAASSIEASGDNSAMADYLRAIIAARSNDGSAVGTNLKNAVGKDASLGETAKKDLEFRNHKDQLTF